MNDDVTQAALLMGAPDAVVFADAEGVIRFWNLQAEALFGHSAAEALGASLDLIVPEPSRKSHWAGFEAAVKRGRFRSEVALQTSRSITKNGTEIFVELSAAIVTGDAGEVRGIMAIARDVTARHQQERARRVQLTELQHELAALRLALAQLSADHK